MLMHHMFMKHIIFFFSQIDVLQTTSGHETRCNERERPKEMYSAGINFYWKRSSRRDLSRFVYEWHMKISKLKN